ncbi:MAG TPA: YceI family protein [Terriglobales bacterium]|nr:YceI family protein [Terriglobales bacterium]
MNSKITILRTFKNSTTAVVAVLLCHAAAFAQQIQVTLNSAQSQVDWTLGATFHTVHGTFKLKSGSILFDSSSGNASGEIVVDATSGESGNQSRDNKMHKDVLESQRYQEISFFPKRVLGKITPQGTSTLQVNGVLHIHGADHEITLSIPVQANDGEVTAKSDFSIPYQAWGMKNPSTLFLKVDDHVDIRIDAVGKLTSTGMAAAER